MEFDDRVTPSPHPFPARRGRGKREFGVLGADEVGSQNPAKRIFPLFSRSAGEKGAQGDMRVTTDGHIKIGVADH